MKTKTQKTEKQEAIKRLQDEIPPGTTIYTVLRHCSASGMQRSIQCLVMRDNQPWDYSWLVKRALGYRLNEKHGGVKIGGCGMDMGFHLVNTLSYCVHGVGRETDTPDQVVARGEARPGYTFGHRWI